MKVTLKLFLSTILLGFTALANHSIDVIRITGSASVYPVISYIYDKSSPDVKKSYKKNPIIESIGTGAGFDVFCKNNASIVNASREIVTKEIENCNQNGLNNLHKITLGIDGITLAYSASSFSDFKLTLEQLRNAISSYIVVDGKVVENKTKTWNEIDPSLPKTKIIIYGPNSSSGTFDYFREIIQKNCLSDKVLTTHFAELGKDAKAECNLMRKETYIQMLDQDTTIASKIRVVKGSIGILRFAFFENSGEFDSVEINGVKPTQQTVENGTYPIARPLFIYFDAKSINKVDGLKTFLTQVAKFAYRDILHLNGGTNEFNNSDSAGVVIQKLKNTNECLESKKVIGFEFNCK